MVILQVFALKVLIRASFVSIPPLLTFSLFRDVDARVLLFVTDLTDFATLFSSSPPPFSLSLTSSFQFEYDAHAPNAPAPTHALFTKSLTSTSAQHAVFGFLTMKEINYFPKPLHPTSSASKTPSASHASVNCAN